MKYIIEKSTDKPNYWECTDIANGVMCVFEQQNFNDNQKFIPLGKIQDPLESSLARIAQEMSSWLRENHYCKVFVCDIQLRIGQRIASLRAQKGYTQAEFAEAIGMNQGNFSRIEAGKYSAGLKVFGRIEQALECELDFIAAEKGKIE